MVLFNTCDFWPPRVFPWMVPSFPRLAEKNGYRWRSSKKPMELGRSCVMEAPTRANFGLESESRKPKREEPHGSIHELFFVTLRNITNHKTMGKIKGFDDFFPCLKDLQFSMAMLLYQRVNGLGSVRRRSSFQHDL